MSRTASLEGETADDDHEPATGADDRGERADGDRTDDHLDDLPDGAGCTEIWEHLSAGRADDA